MSSRGENSGANRTEFDLLDLLDRLETLIEDMDELGVTSRAEAEARMLDIHARIDALEQQGDE